MVIFVDLLYHYLVYEQLSSNFFSDLSHLDVLPLWSVSLSSAVGIGLIALMESNQ